MQGELAVLVPEYKHRWQACVTRRYTFIAVKYIQVNYGF